jgi:rhamnosyltransferase
MRLALDAGFSLYIHDNSPEDPSVGDFCASVGRCTYLTDGTNVGLGRGISRVCARAHAEARPALLFFDQDTVFDARTLEFVEAFHAHRRNLRYTHSAVVFNARAGRQADPADPFPVRDVMLAINSGSLYFLDNVRRLGWHDESYFVDGVDYAFCLRSLVGKMKIGECPVTPGFDHVSEQGDAPYALWGREFSTREYPASRILDATSASARLILASLRTGYPRFGAEIGRQFVGYLGYQAIARILNRLGLRPKA